MSDIEGVFNDIVYLIQDTMVEHKKALTELIKECLEEIQGEIIEKVQDYMQQLQ